MNFITHFLSPEQDLCTPISALRILHFFSGSTSSSTALRPRCHLFRQRGVWEGRLYEDHCLASESKWLCPPAWLPHWRHTQTSGGGQQGVQLCLAMYFFAFFQQRTIMLYGMGVNSEGFGGRYGPGSRLCWLASCVNDLKLRCLCAHADVSPEPQI